MAIAGIGSEPHTFISLCSAHNKNGSLSKQVKVFGYVYKKVAFPTPPFCYSKRNKKIMGPKRYLRYTGHSILNFIVSSMAKTPFSLLSANKKSSNQKVFRQFGVCFLTFSLASLNRAI